MLEQSFVNRTMCTHILKECQLKNCKVALNCFNLNIYSFLIFIIFTFFCLLYNTYISYFPKLWSIKLVSAQGTENNKILLENNPPQSVRPYFVKSSSLLYNHERGEIGKSQEREWLKLPDSSSCPSKRSH